MESMRIILTGYAGRMGHAVASAASEHGHTICAGIDINQTGNNIAAFPEFSLLSDYNGEADVLIDFSHHTALEGILTYALPRRLPVVICTTGHTDSELELMRTASKSIPVFFSRNMSLGVNLIIELAKKAVVMLGDDFDIEIIEKHHNQKLDAPSGTALMIAEELASVRKGESEFVYDRHEYRRLRDKREIGISSIRGGTIVGEHEVIFAGHDEVITVSHSAASREVFARGALRAAAFICGKPAAIYNMSDIVNGMEL